MKSFLLFLSLSMVHGLVAQDGGIDFSKSTLQEALLEARNENKIVFVDAYTSWCGPCKKMSREVFPNREVGQFYNAHFVNLKIDMEKDEGPAVAQKYGVRSYPTLLYLDPSGEVLYRSSGYRLPHQFIELGEKALDPRLKLGAMEKAYKAGAQNDPQLLYTYAMTLYQAQDNRAYAVAADYFDTEPDPKDKAYQDLVFALANQKESPAFSELVKNRAIFEQSLGSAMVSNKLSATLDSYLSENLGSLDPKQAKEILDTYLKEDVSEPVFLRYAIMYHQISGNTKDMARYTDKATDCASFRDWFLLHNAASAILRDSDNKKQLEKARKWSERSVAIQSNATNLDTLARIYARLGNKKEAKSIALSISDLQEQQRSELLQYIQEQQ